MALAGRGARGARPLGWVPVSSADGQQRSLHMSTPTTFPARFEIDPPERISNWRPLVNWLLAIPHFAVIEGLQTAAQALAVISWFWILFTGRLPTGVAEFQAMDVR